MKVVVIARSHNEGSNIWRFCESHQFADEILISDFESVDSTVNLALQFPNVQVRGFYDKVDGFYSHEPKHINQLITWAKERGADWIIYDDIDCFPTKDLQNDIRRKLEEGRFAKVHLYRMYVYLNDWYFPDMNKPGKSLWAWNPHLVHVWCDELGSPKEQNLLDHTPEQKPMELEFPYTTLHCFAQSEEEIERKRTWYARKGQPQLHPLNGCGKLEPLPGWARI